MFMVSLSECQVHGWKKMVTLILFTLEKVELGKLIPAFFVPEKSQKECSLDFNTLYPAK